MDAQKRRHNLSDGEAGRDGLVVRMSFGYSLGEQPASEETPHTASHNGFKSSSSNAARRNSPRSSMQM
jgi:hypothetical protein